MPKIVYHGTYEGSPPHRWGEPFHAGTMKATDDRSYDQVMGGEVSAPAIRQLHAYEISDDAPMSKRVWADPDEWTHDTVPEHKGNRIYPYKNMREDRGSISYVIPSNFVGNHVKHLGIQFQAVFGEDEDHSAVMNAVSTMVGGPSKKKWPH